MNPENANIEVLAPDLWAVRFSWISMIPQIKFTRITDTPLNKIPGQLSPEGVIVLNKDYLLYEDIKRLFLAAVKMSNRTLKKEVAKVQKINTDAKTITGLSLNLWKFAVLMENERRKIKK